MQRPLASGLLAVFAVWCVSAPCRAQAEPQRHEHPSIFAINVPVDATVIGASVAVAFVPPVFGDSIVTPSCPCDPSTVNALDRGAIGNSSQVAATFSDVTVVAAIAAPIGFELATLGTSKAFLQDATVFAQTVLVSNALANIVKLAVQRPRPYVYGTDDPVVLKSTGSYLSFYSGHTTLTFAALSAASMILQVRYRTGLWPWIVTALIGGSVAVERVLAGKHFVTDVTVGAATGIAEGVIIPYVHLKRSQGPDNSLLLLPITHGAQVVFSGNF